MEVQKLSSIHGTYLVWLDVMCVWWLLKLIMHTCMRLRLYIKTLAPSTLQMQIQEGGSVRNFGFVYYAYTTFVVHTNHRGSDAEPAWFRSEPAWFGRRYWTSLFSNVRTNIRTYEPQFDLAKCMYQPKVNQDGPGQHVHCRMAT